MVRVEWLGVRLELSEALLAWRRAANSGWIRCMPIDSIAGRSVALITRQTFCAEPPGREITQRITSIPPTACRSSCRYRWRNIRSVKQGARPGQLQHRPRLANHPRTGGAREPGPAFRLRPGIGRRGSLPGGHSLRIEALPTAPPGIWQCPRSPSPQRHAPTKRGGRAAAGTGRPWSEARGGWSAIPAR